MTADPHVNAGTLSACLDAARHDYAALAGRGLSLDLTRGKPSARQLDLSAEMLSLPGDRYISADGTDCRNYYGPPQGLPELREIFSGFLQVPAGQLVAAGNSSLELMHDCLVHALLGTLPGARRRWADEDRIAFLCPVPGYDRHFALCERFGIEMIPVPMTAEGPDMAAVERSVGADAVHRILDGQLGGTGLATWSAPRGGYFIAVSVLDGRAREVVRRAAGIGIALTPAGVTHPCGDDPRDRTLRIAPSYPDLPELELAVSGLAACIRLACYERLSAGRIPGPR